MLENKRSKPAQRTHVAAEGPWWYNDAKISPRRTGRFRGMAVEEVNLQHGQGGRLRGKRRRSATDMGVEKAAPGRPMDQVTLL